MNKMLESVDTLSIYTHNIFYKKNKKGKEKCLYKRYL